MNEERKMTEKGSKREGDREEKEGIGSEAKKKGSKPMFPQSLALFTQLFISHFSL